MASARSLCAARSQRLERCLGGWPIRLTCLWPETGRRPSKLAPSLAKLTISRAGGQTESRLILIEFLMFLSDEHEGSI